MNSIKWFFMSPNKKLEYIFKVLYRNKQRLHFAGFIFDFINMKIEVDDCSNLTQQKIDSLKVVSEPQKSEDNNEF